LAQRFKRSKKAMDWSSQTLLHSIGFEQGWSHWLLAAGTKRKTQATDLEFDSAQLCLEAAALGHGIALARSSYVADYLASKRLVALSQLQLEAKDQVYLTMALGLSPQAPAALFRDYLLSRSPP
jgi:LysR family glycine cleavage system transcriptional activator